MAKMSNNQCLSVAERNCAEQPENVSVEKNVLHLGFSAKAEFY